MSIVKKTTDIGNGWTGTIWMHDGNKALTLRNDKKGERIDLNVNETAKLKAMFDEYDRQRAAA